jgi:hypothetical protein
MSMTRFGRLTAALLLSGAGLAASAPAHADPGDVSVNVEGGIGTMISHDQRSGWVLPDGRTEKFNKVDFEGALHAGLVITDPLSLQLAVASW